MVPVVADAVEPVVWAQAKGRPGKRRAKVTHHARGVAREYTIHLSIWVRSAILADWVPLRMTLQNQVLKNKPSQLPKSRCRTSASRSRQIVFFAR
jgi:hypothetical protein